VTLVWTHTIALPPFRGLFIITRFLARTRIGQFVFRGHMLKHEGNGLTALTRDLRTNGGTIK
jgi:hypothetical protein